MPKSGLIPSSARFRHFLKATAVPILDRSGALRLANRLGEQAPRMVLNYHNIRGDLFRTHAEFLKRHAQVTDAESIFSSPAAGGGTPVVALTFDDGYASFIEEIVPILEGYGLPALWFVPTGGVENGCPFWFDRVRTAILWTGKKRILFGGSRWDLTRWNRIYVASEISRRIKQAAGGRREALVCELLAEAGESPEPIRRRLRPASREQVRSLNGRRVAVGGHSHTHPQMSELTDRELASELSVSKRLLEEWTGGPVRHFAFPSGDYDDRVIRAIREAGYAAAWTTEPRLLCAGEDRYRLPRIPIDDEAPVGLLRAKMTPVLHRLGIL